jgi:hypothetical protein
MVTEKKLYELLSNSPSKNKKNSKLDDSFLISDIPPE